MTDGAAEVGEACTWRRIRLKPGNDPEVKEGSSSGRTEVLVKSGDQFVTIGCKPWRRS